MKFIVLFQIFSVFNAKMFFMYNNINLSHNLYYIKNNSYIYIYQKKNLKASFILSKSINVYLESQIFNFKIVLNENNQPRLFMITNILTNIDWNYYLVENLQKNKIIAPNFEIYEKILQLTKLKCHRVTVMVNV